MAIEYNFFSICFVYIPKKNNTFFIYYFLSFSFFFSLPFDEVPIKEEGTIKSPSTVFNYDCLSRRMQWGEARWGANCERSVSFLTQLLFLAHTNLLSCFCWCCCISNLSHSLMGIKTGKKGLLHKRNSWFRCPERIVSYFNLEREFM